MHFLLWTKWSHESTNFDTFKCSDENFPNSSSHFPNHKSFFFSELAWLFRLFNNFSVIFLVKRYILFTKGTNQSPGFLDYLVLGTNFKFFALLKKKSFFPQILHHSLVYWDITPLYLFSWNFIYFQQKEPIIVKSWQNFTWAVKSLTFCALVCSFCKNHIKFLLKKYRRLISHDTEEWCNV